MKTYSPTTSASKAQVAVTIALAWFIKNGYEVAIPFDHASSADLLVRQTDKRTKNGSINWFSVQVKSFYGNTANLCRTTSTGRSVYGIGEADLFAAVDTNSGEVFVLSNTHDLPMRISKRRAAKSISPFVTLGRDDQDPRAVQLCLF